MATRTLIIMRHAKSSWDSGVPRDFDRPLNARGERDAPRMGAWLSRQALAPELVVASPALRTRQSAEAVVGALGLATPPPLRFEPDIYDATLPRLIDVLQRLPEGPSPVLLVGHNPGMELLLLELAAPGLSRQVEGKLMPTGAVYCLDFAGGWTPLLPGSGRLRAWMHPRRLPCEPG